MYNKNLLNDYSDTFETISYTFKSFDSFENWENKLRDLYENGGIKKVIKTVKTYMMKKELTDYSDEYITELSWYILGYELDCL